MREIPDFPATTEEKWQRTFHNKRASGPVQPFTDAPDLVNSANTSQSHRQFYKADRGTGKGKLRSADYAG